MRASTKWKIERLTYIAFIPISYWFITIFLKTFSESVSLQTIFSVNLNKFLIFLFFFISSFHIRIQLIKVYEDYFNIKKIKLFSSLTDIAIFCCLLSFLPILFFNS